MPMKDKFYSAVHKYNMFCGGERVIVGVSGGADSMCLLYLLNEEKDKLNISLVAAHLNHGIRGEEALRDENFVKDFCARHGIECIVRRSDIPALAKEQGKSIELCARDERYSFFNSLGADKIATAHTGSDCIETMLMNLSRGAALHGLCSIPAVRDNIVRPLIYFSREDTERCCRENNIDYVTDSTNLSDEYTRNKYRLNVLPQLKEINSAFEANALRCISLLKTDDDFIESSAAAEFHRAFSAENRTLDFSLVENRHRSIISRLTAKYIQTLSKSDFEMKHIDMLCGNIGGQFSLTLPGGDIVKIDGLLMKFSGSACAASAEQLFQETAFNKNFPFSLRIGSTLVECFPSDTIPRESGCLAVDFFKIDDIIVCRSKQPGDSITLKNRRCSKTLKKLFNELKLPPEKRRNIPVLADSAGIIAVAGIAAAAARLPDGSSTKYLIIKNGVW